jgi:hypothetical protein
MYQGRKPNFADEIVHIRGHDLRILQWGLSIDPSPPQGERRVRSGSLRRKWRGARWHGMASAGGIHGWEAITGIIGSS